MGDLSYNVEVAVPLGGILRMLGWSRRKFFYWRMELLESGVIFYCRHGRPPKRRIYAFPSIVMRWAALKAMKGETI